METPIYDFIKEYEKKAVVRLHMPGHKGTTFLGCEGLDITEIDGADDLYHPQGIIAKSEQNATNLFGSRKTFYATGGSSQCILAMVYLAMIYGKKKEQDAKILAGRNAHKAFLHSCALLDLAVCWVYPKEKTSLCACSILPEELERTLRSMEDGDGLPFAVFITSPDYLGNMADIKGLSAVCKNYGIPLLVDNAHGAYLHFLPKSIHPLDLGADLCCDSAHKTLPVLTGGAYLHIGKNAVAPFEEYGKSALGLFGSSSPSYLTLQSLDLCNRVLADGYEQKLELCQKKIEKLRLALAQKGYPAWQFEPLKLMIEAGKIGMSGDEMAELLRKNGIEVEFSDDWHLVMMFTPQTKDCDFDKVYDALPFMTDRQEKEEKAIVPTKGEQVISIREAMFAKRRRVCVEESLGQICAMPAVSCPPAIPIAISGERITEQMVALFVRYGIEEVDVVWDL
ncbi:MAG: hypothetical protein ACK5I7_07935 [Anaerotignum sp.]